MIKLSPERWKTIQNINSYRNDNIQYVKDRKHYGKSDKWAFPDDDKGDCEDVSIAKQHDLKQAGIESYLCTCWCYPNRPPDDRGYHAVCLVNTNFGDYILDNRFPGVYHYEDCYYLWHMREMPDETWRLIKN